MMAYLGERLTGSTKKIYAYVGLPGAEDWLYHQEGLEPYVVSEQRIRLAAGNPRVLLRNGRLIKTVDASSVALSKRVLDRLVRQRLDNQEPFVLAINFLSKEALRWFRKVKAAAWGYEVIVVKAMDNPGNLGEGDDDESVDRLPKYIRRYETVDWSGFGRVITPHEMLDELVKPLRFETLHSPKKLVVFSDVHGDSRHLNEQLARLGPDTMVAFLGDAIDRGPDSAGVIRALIAHNDGLNLLGNHEHRLLAWYQEHRENSAALKEFTEKTLPQLETAGITEREIRTLIAGMGTYLAINFAGKKLLLSHAGLEPVQVAQWLQPKHLTAGIALTATNTFIHGLSDGQHSVYTRDIDRVWADSTEMAGIIAIHGHRNRFNRDVTANHSLSFNLTDGDGATFRYLILNAAGHEYELHIKSRDGLWEDVKRGDF